MSGARSLPAAPGSITFLVLAHDHPEQLTRLLQRLLLDPNDHALVHVDGASPLQPFRDAIAEAGLRNWCGFTGTRFIIRWGDFAIVRATLELLRTAATERPASAYVLLSAADYPIRPPRLLREELASGAIYMDCTPMPDVVQQKPLSRLQYFYVGARKRGSARVALLNKVLRRLPIRDVARGLEGAQPYGGSQWWALPDAIARSVLRYTDEHPRTVRFFARSLNPDEMYFQTVVRRVAGDHPMRAPLTWADWSRPVSPGSPATLVDDVDDLERVRAASGEHWFARKFDWARSRDLLDQIDTELLEVG